MEQDFKSYNSRPVNGGIQYVHFFPNGYGVSIVQNRYTYGGNDGLWELAVLKGNKDHWEITYTTPITNDVVGWLKEDKVNELCEQVAALPEAQEEPQEAPTAEDCWDGDASHSE